MTKQKRGFAAMTPEQRRILSSMGGKASHELGRGHEWTSDTARVAGRKGGKASRAKKLEGPAT